MEKLNQLMSAELIVGPDAINATELLYDIVGDDELFDILNDLADKSQGRANIWDDSDVQRRLAELGVQTPQSTQAEPANVAQDTAPPQPAAAAPAAPPVAEGDNMSTFEEDRELAEMLKYAGVPIQEGVLTDSTGSTLEHIKDTFRRDVKDFEQTGDMSDHLFHALYDYYFDDMPYGTKKGRDGDPHEWVSDRFAQDIGMNENLVTKMIEPVSECNYTMEGEYCPAHGLAECGQASGGAVGMPFSLGEEGFGPAATAALQQGKSEIAVHSADVDDKNAADNSAVARSILIKEKKTDDPINSN
jgi:hypothetical protein